MEVSSTYRVNGCQRERQNNTAKLGGKYSRRNQDSEAISTARLEGGRDRMDGRWGSVRSVLSLGLVSFGCLDEILIMIKSEIHIKKKNYMTSGERLERCVGGAFSPMLTTKSCFTCLLHEH